jgi:hypothetical protein
MSWTVEQVERRLAAILLSLEQDPRFAVTRLKKITAVMVLTFVVFQKPDHRDLFPSGLRPAAGGP